MDAPGPATRLADRYRLTEQLATGATAAVWRASDELLDRPVAIKILHPHLADTDLAGRFAAEARIAATVGHPSLVAVYDTLTGPPPAIVLELVDGPDLRQRLDTGRFSFAAVLGLGRAVADGLDAVHRAGLVHRDVKPANIIYTHDGRPKLGDFGIATSSAGDRTATGVVLGTAKYLAPEQVRGGVVDARTDVYALCVVLYEAVCGRPPFDRPGGDLPTAMARLEEAPRPPSDLRPDIPRGLEAIIMRGLELDPADRWSTARALRDALTAETAELDPSLEPIDRADGRSDVAPIRDTTATMTLSDETAPPPEGGVSVDRPRKGSRRRLVRSSLIVVAFTTIAGLGWVLVTDGNPLGDAIDELGNAGSSPVVLTVAAFDPDGTGPPGEHDELAPNVSDGDIDTEWHTESYEDRSFGVKAGVGLVVELAEPVDVASVEITTDREDWAAEIYVADHAGGSLADWGPSRVVAGGLSETATLRPAARGAALLVWFTDLGVGGPPYRLAVYEITVR